MFLYAFCCYFQTGETTAPATADEESAAPAASTSDVKEEPKSEKTEKENGATAENEPEDPTGESIIATDKRFWFL